MNTMYKISRIMLLAHAAAWHLYNENYRAEQHGMISLTLNSDWVEPKDPNNERDVQAASDYLDVNQHSLLFS